MYNCMYSIHLITAVQVVTGVVEIKWRVKPQWGLLQVCLLSDAAVKVRCEMQAQQRSSAVGLSSEAVTHFMELNTEQTG